MTDHEIREYTETGAERRGPFAVSLGASIGIALTIVSFLADMTELREWAVSLSIVAFIITALFGVVLFWRIRFWQWCRYPFWVAAFIAVVFGMVALAQNIIPGAKEEPMLMRLANALTRIDTNTQEIGDDVVDLNRKIDALLVAQGIENLTAEERDSLRKTLEALLTATEVERRAAGAKLTADKPDPEGALADLKRLVMQQEDSVADAAKTWKEIGAIAFLTDTYEARDAYKRATQLAPTDAEAWNQFGHLEKRLGNLDSAQAAYEQVLAFGNDRIDNVLIAIALGNLGLIERARGNLDAAEAYHRRSLALEEALGRKEGMAIQFSNLGQIALARGDEAGAAKLWRQALGIFEDMGSANAVTVRAWLADMEE